MSTKQYMIPGNCEPCRTVAIYLTQGGTTPDAVCKEHGFPIELNKSMGFHPAPPPDLNLQELTMEGQTVLNGEDKGKKYDGGKPMVQLLSPTAMIKIAEVMTFGAKKYGADNWREGIAWTRVIGAVLRHIFAWLSGQDRDPETGISHLAHAGCGIMFLLEYEETRKDKDDRYTTSLRSRVDSQPGKV